MILLDFPPGLKNIVLGNPNIPKDFGSTSALDIAFFDVGQGDCALIGINNAYIIIDTGDEDKGYQILRYLDKLNVKNIDTMILTHPHSDHIGGADVLMENIKVNNICIPDAANITNSFESILDVADKYKVHISIPNIGDKLYFEGMELTFLHPEKGKEFENMNDVSLVVKVENSYGSALFAGDAESIAELDMLSSKIDLNADILKAGHHGSMTSTSEEFLDAVAPSKVIISCGEHNDFGHPHEQVIDLLKSKNINYYITHEKGSIYFSLTESGLKITTER